MVTSAAWITARPEGPSRPSTKTSAARELVLQNYGDFVERFLEDLLLDH